MTNELTLPKSLIDATKNYFSDLDTCLKLAVQLVWPNGKPTCHHCGSQESHYIETRRIWRCKDCKKQYSVKLGTIFEDSPLGLDKWFMAIWLIANCKNGVSSYEIARDLEITQKSAWFMLHRIRHAMKTGSFRLSGEVEADETYIGGREKNKHADKKQRLGRGGIGKTIVAAVLERSEHKDKPSRVRTKIIDNTDRKTMRALVQEHVEEGSAVYTDAHSGYSTLSPDYAHEFVDHALVYVRGKVHTNGLENYFSLLKRSIKGTYVAIEPWQLGRYLDEQSFRFAERHMTDGERFAKVLSMIAHKRLTWEELTSASTDYFREVLPSW